MQQENLLSYKSNIYSQNGEDGIIAAIFDRIGVSYKMCCDVGAWDGVHLSNCRKLILDGWGAVMIEGDPDRFNDLISNYSSNPSVICVNSFVDEGENRLDSILGEHKVKNLDLVSIDIDGLDYEIFDTLDVRPRVICIEVNAGHNPRAESRLDRDVAKDNIGQPLRVFVSIADSKGYDLVCYSGNAFFVRRDVIKKASLLVLSAEQAYRQFLEQLPVPAKDWLYLVNLGIVNPYYRFANPYLSRANLRISLLRASCLLLRERHYALGRSFKRLLSALAKALQGRVWSICRSLRPLWAVFARRVK